MMVIQIIGMTMYLDRLWCRDRVTIPAEQNVERSKLMNKGFNAKAHAMFERVKASKKAERAAERDAERDAESDDKRDLPDGTGMKTEG
jgi:hypothetical protein